VVRRPREERHDGQAGLLLAAVGPGWRLAVRGASEGAGGLAFGKGGVIGAGDRAAQITASAGAISVTSNAFAIGRGRLHRGWSAVLSRAGVDTPFAVSLRAEDAGANVIETFTEPVTLGVVREVNRPLRVGLPGQLRTSRSRPRFHRQASKKRTRGLGVRPRAFGS
jgi:hypothetical protein